MVAAQRSWFKGTLGWWGVEWVSAWTRRWNRRRSWEEGVEGGASVKSARGLRRRRSRPRTERTRRLPPITVTLTGLIKGNVTVREFDTCRDVLETVYDVPDGLRLVRGTGDAAVMLSQGQRMRQGRWAVQDGESLAVFSWRDGVSHGSRCT